MATGLEIRDSTSVDLAEIELLYPLAFPQEDLIPLVRDLLADDVITTSLVGVIDSQIVGHVIFTDCGVSGGAATASLLGPLAVTPVRHRQGIGSALVRAGLQQMKDNDVSVVCLLGDPAYYGRLGFVRATSIQPPYRLPVKYESAWQSQELSDRRPATTGKLLVPKPWRQPPLWSP